MVKTTKNQRILFGFLKSILLVAAAILLYFQWRKANVNNQDFMLSQWWSMAIAVALVPLNWGLEFLKWKLTLRQAGVDQTIEHTRNSFFAGMITGMLTPNMLGNFVGRMFYFQRRDRISITVLTLLTNYTQFVSTLIFGAISFFILQQTPFGLLDNAVSWLALSVLLPFIIFVFYFDDLFRWIFPGRMRLTQRLKSTKGNFVFKGKILGISLLRHAVFVLQFSSVLIAFGAEWNSSVFFWIWQYYFWVTLAPSLFLGKVIIRDSIALWVFGFAGLSVTAVLPSSLTIWVINLLIPTLLALIFVRKPKAA